MPSTFGTPAIGDRGAVAAPHYLATLAGTNVLRDGGSAVDAAIAANMVLGVVWPNMCGPGGDLFAQVWSPADQTVHALNSSGRAGAGMTVDAYRGLGHTSMPQRGPHSITVPGAVDGWFALHQRWGRLDMERVARDAVALASEGFRITSYVCDAIAANAHLLGRAFLPNGLPRPGDRFVQKDLAQSLATIAREGPQSMYGGALGERVVTFLQQHGSALTLDDFAAHRSEWVAPIGVDYGPTHVSQLPPNSQGLALLQMLQMLTGRDINGWSPAERVHQMVERKKLAFSDRDAFVGDPACAEVPVDRLLDATYARRRSEGIGIGTGPRPGTVQAGHAAGDGDTIYLCAADRDGMVVSLIQSLFSSFGSGLHAAGTGITLQNRGGGFVLDEAHPNVLRPGKRPFHTLMPGLALRDGRPWLAFGTRGADGQAQTGLQMLVGLIDLGLSPQETIETPRWVHDPPGDRFSRDALVLEAGLAPIAAELSDRGHDVIVSEPLDYIMGTVQMIRVDQERGYVEAVSDPRGDGIALAL